MRTAVVDVHAFDDAVADRPAAPDNPPAHSSVSGAIVRPRADGRKAPALFADWLKAVLAGRVCDSLP